MGGARAVGKAGEARVCVLEGGGGAASSTCAMQRRSERRALEGGGVGVRWCPTQQCRQLHGRRAAACSGVQHLQLGSSQTRHRCAGTQVQKLLRCMVGCVPQGTAQSNDIVLQSCSMVGGGREGGWRVEWRLH